MTLLTARRAPEQRVEIAATVSWTMLGRAIDPSLPPSSGLTLELSIRGECGGPLHRAAGEARGRLTLVACGPELPEPRLLLDAPFAGTVETADGWESTEIRSHGPRPVRIELVTAEAAAGSGAADEPDGPLPERLFYVRTDLFSVLGIPGGAYAAPRLARPAD